ncbi:MAG: uracil-DNA glycosylase [Carbonactinosporaceae bacterium]
MTPNALARTAGTWDELAARVAACRACPELAVARSQVVVGRHPPGAGLLLVGEAPGAQEDLAGVPFVGRAGRLLDSLLAESGLGRAEVAMVNVLKCRPPRNRKPRRGEVDRCAPWLARQVELVDPLVVCTLGGTAAEWALGRGVRVGTARGGAHRYAGRPLVVTYHPSAAIRSGPRGECMAALLEDLRLAARLARRPGPGAGTAAGAGAGTGAGR